MDEEDGDELRRRMEMDKEYGEWMKRMEMNGLGLRLELGLGFWDRV